MFTSGLLRFLPLISSCGLLCLGFFVFFRHPRRTANILFMTSCLFTAFLEALAAVFIFVEPESTLGLIQPLYVTMMVPALISAMAFSIALSRRDALEALIRWRFPMAALATYGVITAGWIWLTPNGISLAADTPPVMIFQKSIRPFLLFVIASLLLIIFQMEKLFSMTSGSRRWQIKYALLAIASASLFFLIQAGLIFYGMRFRADLIPANSMVLLASQSLVLFALVRHRFLEVRVFISREVTYRAFMTSAAAAYLASVALFGYWSSTSGHRYGLMVAVGGGFLLMVAGAAGLLSTTVRGGVRHYINTHFYRNKYEYRSRWNSFTRHLAAIDDRKELARVILLEISETMWVTRSSLWMISDDGSRYYCAAVNELAPTSLKLEMESALIRALAGMSAATAVEDLLQDKTLVQENGKLLEDLSAVVCAPLKVGERMVGFITLGPNLFEQTFDIEDREMLETLSSQAAAAIYRNILSEELATARGLESLNRVSAFIIHDLKNTVSMLSMVLQNAAENLHRPEFQKDALNVISRSVEKMKRLVDRFSLTKDRGMELNFTALDIHDIINKTVERLQLEDFRGVTVIRDYTDLPPLQADSKLISHLFENLIINALQALPHGGGEIRLTTNELPCGAITVEVADSGCGMSSEMIRDKLFKPFHTTKEKGLGIGLYQCRNIVTAHGGRIDAECREGGGSLFRVTFPVRSSAEERRTTSVSKGAKLSQGRV
jgi:putative PEP-CTERM system histidine kinase